MLLSSIVTCSVAGLGLGLAFGFGFAFALGLAAVLTAVCACTVGFRVESQLATAALPAVRCSPRRKSPSPWRACLARDFTLATAFRGTRPGSRRFRLLIAWQSRRTAPARSSSGRAHGTRRLRAALR